MNKNKLSEPVKQRYQFEFGEFAAQDPSFNISKLKQISFVFDKDKRGAILLDDIGVIQNMTNTHNTNGESKLTTQVSAGAPKLNVDQSPAATLEL